MITITAQDFKQFFHRQQFDYGTTFPQVTDPEIEQAIMEAGLVFNHELYPTDAIEKTCLLYCSAHFLQNDLDAADSGGQTKILQNSRSADGLSESLEIPDWMKQGEFALYSTTYYGQQWLLLSKPYLDGAVFAIGGRTQY